MKYNQGFALLIGVNEYLDPAISDLPATSNDVDLLNEILVNPHVCAFKLENVLCLTGPGAGRQEIISGLHWLSQQTKNAPLSTTILYFSGHGWKRTSGSRQAYYLLPYDANLSAINSSLLSTDKLVELLEGIKSERLVVIFDACHSGGMYKDVEDLLPEGFIKSSIPPDVILSKLNSGSGRVIISSSRPNERSFIMASDYKYSIFTFHLVEALKGQAHSYYDDTIGIIDLFTYIEHQVPHTALKQVDPFTSLPAQQHPIMDSIKAENFPIALRKTGKSSPIFNNAILAEKSKSQKDERMNIRRNELLVPLELYEAQRVAIEEDIALNARDAQMVVILRKRLDYINREIANLHRAIDELDEEVSKK